MPNDMQSLLDTRLTELEGTDFPEPETTPEPPAQDMGGMLDMRLQEIERESEASDRRTLPGYARNVLRAPLEGAAGAAGGIVEGVGLDIERVRRELGFEPRKVDDVPTVQAGRGIAKGGQEMADIDPDYRGTLAVDSAVGGGSLFTFALLGLAGHGAGTGISRATTGKPMGRGGEFAAQMGPAATAAQFAGVSEAHHHVTEFMRDYPELAAEAGLTEDSALNIATGMQPRGAGIMQVTPVVSLLRPMTGRLPQQTIRRMTETGINEYVVENLGAAIQNNLRQQYDPDHPLWDEIPYRGETAGIGAAALALLMSPLNRRGRAIQSRGATTDGQPTPDEALQGALDDAGVDLSDLYEMESSDAFEAGLFQRLSAQFGHSDTPQAQGDPRSDAGPAVGEAAPAAADATGAGLRGLGADQARPDAPGITPDAPTMPEMPAAQDARPVEIPDVDALEPAETITVDAPAENTYEPYADTLRDMADRAGWAERGGRGIQDAEGEYIGRTNWVPNEPWFQNDMASDERLSGNAAREAVEKALRGDKLRAKEQRFVDRLVEISDEQQALTDQAMAEIDADPGFTVDADDYIPGFDSEPLQTEALTDEELSEIFAAPAGDTAEQGTARPAVPETQGDAAEGPGTGVTARHGEGAPEAEPLTLDQQTPEQLAKLAADRDAAEAAEAQRQERLRQQDQLGDFRLTGSQSEADQAMAAGQQDLLSQTGRRRGQEEAPAASENTVFTEDAADRAREVLRRKLGQMNAGIDPEVMQAGITLAGYHIEKGARSFSAYARAMVGDLGDSVRPYLKSWYMGVKYDPRAAGFDGMDSAADVESADVDAALADPEPGAPPAEATPAAQPEATETPAPEAGVSRSGERQAETVSVDTLNAWRRNAKSVGTRRGWTVFDDTEIGNQFVLMRRVFERNEAGGGSESAERVDGFASRQDAENWAEANPATGQAAAQEAPDRTESDGLIFKKDGAPFQTERAALVARNRDDLKGRKDQLEAVEVEGGWALQQRAEAQPEQGDEAATTPARRTQQAEPEVVDSDEADLATRTRAEAAGESPERARLIAVREFLDAWIEDYTVPTEIAESVGNLFRHISTNLEKGGDLDSLQRDAAASMREWVADASLDADVAAEINGFVRGFESAGFGPAPQADAPAVAFQATHELPDGTQVQATGEPDVYVDREGVEIEDSGAEPIADAPAEAPTGDLAQQLEQTRRLIRDGADLSTIGKARKAMAEVMGEPVQPGSQAAKRAEELIEAAAVMEARGIARTETDPQAAYAKIRAIQDVLPNLATRTSTSVSQQAYSTPLSISYIASRMAGVSDASSVYESSAGHGALLLEAGSSQNIAANELNEGRAERLREVYPEATVTTDNAVTFMPGRKRFDVVIANPPFGTLKDAEGATQEFSVGDFTTKEIDHAIVMQTLEAMKDDGRAAFIIGGTQGKNAEAREAQYRAGKRLSFFKRLYDDYNVTGHATLDGSLYAQQGAGYPVDIIVIEGRGQSGLKVPGAEAPPLITSLDQLGEVLNDQSVLVPEARKLDGADPRFDSSAEGFQSVRSGLSGGAGRAGAGAGGRRSGSESGDADGGARTGGGRADAGDTRGSGGRRADADRQQPGASGLPAREGAAAASTDAGAQADTRGARGGRGDDTGRVGRDDSAGSDTGVTGTARQAAYVPQSKSANVGTLVPVNMQSSVRDALQGLGDRVGSLDAFVAESLGMEADTIGNYFSAEQVDALALALDNFNKGAGFIIGDQTGVGKGRVVAGIIRYAIQQGRTPIFVTEKPNLYADMYRDLSDIGFGNVKMLMTNSRLKVTLDDAGNEVLKSPGSKNHNAALQRMAQSGDLGDHDVIFTTYSQMQAVKGERTARMDFLERFADGGVVVFDESHNAGGTGTSSTESDRGGKGDDLNRAKFARDIAGLAHSVMYSSATYAKRPNVMDLYFRTDMSKAVPDISALPEAIQAGGVPLQQVVASMLSRAGQYIRRERSFEGVRYETVPTDVDTALAERVSEIMSSVHRFDEAKNGAVESIKKAAAQQAKRIGASTAVGEAGMKSTNFTSVMHNLIDQMLLSLKMNATIEQVDTALKEGRKPVVTLSNTMGSFVEQFAEDMDLNPGDPISLSFGDLLNRYLEKSREVSVKESEGAKESKKYRLTNEDLGPRGVRMYEEAQGLIEGLDLSSMPVSPIDYLRYSLQDRGHKTAEITGRQEIIDYSEGVPVYRRRPGSEVSINGRRQAISQFNSGEIDVIVLNQAGSTGISLHASDKFKDQSQREMIIAQAEKNIDTHMQMLGRVHRTGQVVTPVYKQLVANIPAEKRPASVLAKKMASLNANTTASRGSDLTAENVPDFMNEFGDQVATQVMADNPEWHRTLGSPLGTLDSSDVTEGAIAKVTGRVPLLPVSQQEQLYQILEAEYRDMLEQLEASGSSPLEAKTLDLDARTITEEVVYTGESGSDSPFAGDAIAETVDMKRTGKPMTWDELQGALKNALGVDSDSTDALVVAGREQHSDNRRAAEADFEVYLQKQVDNASTPEAASKMRDSLAAQQGLFGERMNTVIPGSTVALSTDGGPMQGVVINVERKGKAANPLALSDWRAVIAVTDAQRQITVPLSQIGQSENARVMIKRTPKRLAQMQDVFNEASSQSREQRVIITGNLLAGYGQFSSGQIINFTDAQDQTRQGILMPKKFDLQAQKDAKPTAFSRADQIIEFLDGDRDRMVESNDGELIIRRINNREYMLEVPASKRRGGRFFLSEVLLGAAQSEFIKSGSSMRMRVEKPNAEDTIRSLLANNQLVTKTHKDEARKITGQEEQDAQPSAAGARFSRGESSDTVGMDVGEMTDAEFAQYFSEDAGAEVPGVGRRGQRQRAAAGSAVRSDENARTVGGGAPRMGWVSASRVRDQGAGPRLVYRGARAAIRPETFSTESLGRGTGHPTSGLGVWFTTDQGEASRYGAHVDSVHLDIRNPKVFRPETMPQFDSVEEATAYRDRLREQGYDGIMLDQTEVGGPVHFVAFDADQTILPDEGSAQFSFAGERAETADRYALSSAQERIAAGEDTDAVRQDTGWHQGADGRWRFEISDDQASIKKPWPHKEQSFGDIWEQVLSRYLAEGRDNVTVGDILDHPQLFSAYPWIAGVSVGRQESRGASFVPASGGEPAAIRINDQIPMSEVRSSLLHELQHMIQHREGFAVGGSPEGVAISPEYFVPQVREAFDALQRTAKADPGRLGDLMRKKHDQGIRGAELQELERLMKARPEFAAWRDAVGEMGSPYETYRRLAGEAEARNVQTRQGMTEAERQAAPPGTTQDVADADVIVTFNGREMADAPAPANARATQEGSREAGIPVAEAEAAVSGLMKGWKGAPKVRVVATEADLPPALRRKVQQEGAAGTVSAAYWDNQVFIVASRTPSAEVVQQKVLHEVVGHYGLRKLVGQDLGRVLNQVWVMHGRNHAEVRDIIRRYFTGSNRFDVNNQKHRDLVAEELIAHMAERGTRPSLVQRVRAMIRDWLRRRGWDLAMNDADLANLIRQARRVAETGEISSDPPSMFGRDTPAALSRDEGDRPQGRDLPETVNVDGAIRPTRNSDGHVIHPTEQGVRNFWRWFGDSKVTDFQGRPLVVYHGRHGIGNKAPEGISQFRPGAGKLNISAAEKSGDNLHGQGIWFTDSAWAASDYAGTEDVSTPVAMPEASVYPVYLRIENPSKMGWKDARNESADDLRKQGHDGAMILENENWAALDPSQIKSAVGNRGTFDADSDDIRFSRTDPDKFKNQPPEESGPLMEKHARAQRSIFAGQPVDGIFRYIFSLGDQLDSAGRWKPGVKLDKAVKAAIMDWKPNPDGSFGWMNPALESARAGLIDRFGLDQAFVQREFESQSEQATIEGMGEQFAKQLGAAGVGIKEAKVLQQILNGEDVGPENLRQLAEPIRAAIDEFGQELVNLGFLRAEDYQRHLGKYLHRAYLKYEQQRDGLPKWAQQAMRKHRRKIHGDELKARGLKEDVTMERLLKDAPQGWWGRKTRKGEADKQLVNTEWKLLDLVRIKGEGSQTLGGIDAGKAKGRILKRVWWPADAPVPQSMSEYTDRGTWTVTGTAKGGKIRLRRDFTKAERDSMGEILDARYNIIRTFQLMSHDISSGKFFRDIAQNPEWAVTTPESGDVVAKPSEARRMRTFAEADWVEVPTTMVSGTSVHQWGALAGMYVRPAIWRDLNEMDRMQQQGTWRAILNQWKVNKTARSPVVHMNNVMSNFVLMDLIDVRLQDLARGIAEYRNKGEMYLEARDNGAFGAGFVRQELNRNVVDPILDELMADMRQHRDTVEGRTRALSNMGYKLWTLAKKGDRKMVDFYQTEDELFRMATFMRHRAMGASAPEAAMIAREQFLNYDIRAPWVNAARSTVLPFISYTYRAVPAIAQAIMHRPWKLAKYATIGYLANLLAFELEPGDEDEERRTMRPQVQGMTWASIPFTDIGFHRMMRMPWRDEHDNPVYLDIFRWIPAGDVFDTNQGQFGAPAWLQFGGPMQLAFEMVLNRSGFTGRDIVDRETATGTEAAKSRLDYLWKAWMPSASYIPGSWHNDKLVSALRGERDMLDRPYSIPTAAASGFGVKLQPHDVELGYYFRGSAIQRKLGALRGEARQIERDHARGIGTEASRQAGLKRVEDKIRRLEKDARRLHGRD